MHQSRFFHISPSGELARFTAIEEAPARTREGGFVWLDFSHPTREELLPLVDLFALHPLAVEDCLDEKQLPKMEDYPRNTFFVFNTFDFSHHTLSVHELDVVLGDRFLITVRANAADDQALLQDLPRILERNIENARQGPAFLLHVLLDQIVDRKFLAIEAVEEDLDSAEETILADLARFNPAELLHLRRDLLTLRKTLFHEREILVKICRKDCPFISDKAVYLYRDIYDHLTKSFELTESCRDIVTSLMEMYLSMLNNRMAKSANETNVTVKRLTFITTVFMPLTFLTGVLGMSEFSMIIGPENWKTGYPIFLAATAIVAVLNYYLLKWLDRPDSSRTGPQAP